jgi:Fe-S cluster assembly protein SufD
MSAFLDNVEKLFSSEEPLQQKAFARFLEKGIPAYHYLPLSQLRNFKIQAPKDKPGSYQRTSDSPFSLVFLNGAFHHEMSDTLSEEIVLLPLSEALSEYPAFLASHLEKQLAEEKDALAHMTAALTRNGYFLYIPPSSKISLSIINIQTAKSAFAHIEILAGRKSTADITLKNYTQMLDPAFSSELINVQLEEEASLTLWKIDSYQTKEWAFSFNRVSQKAGSHYKTAIVTNGAHASRHDIKVALNGEEARCEIGGLAKLKGFCQAHSRVLVEHKAPHTTSHQLFKSILDDVARSSFQGEIFVTSNALNTNPFQLNKSLLLSDKAIAYSRPELQIFADDVKASHGATVGELDEEMLFYLASRGIPKPLATQMLLDSFAEDIVSWFSSPLSQNEARKLLA